MRDEALGDIPVLGVQEAVDHSEDGLDILEVLLVGCQVLPLHPLGVGVGIVAVPHSFLLLNLLCTVVLHFLLGRAARHLLRHFRLIVPLEYSREDPQAFQDSLHEIVLEGVVSKLVEPVHAEQIRNNLDKLLACTDLDLVPLTVSLLVREAGEEVDQQLEGVLVLEVGREEVGEG